MTNTRLLKAAIVKQGLTQAEVAKQIGISYQSFNGKVNNKTEFQLSEVLDLCKVLEITVDERDSIFLSKK